jgi:S1-C subfamily serine protease
MATKSDKKEVPKKTRTSASSKAAADKALVQSVSSTQSSRAGRTYTITIPDFPKMSRPGLPRDPRARFSTIAAVIIIIALISGAFGGWIETRNNSTGFIASTLSGQEKVVTSQGQLTNEIAKVLGPSVVSVNVDITASSGGSDTGGFGLNGFAQPEEEQAAGTGIILSSNGIIITNRHVVPVGTTSVSVTLSNGTELKNVTVIGRTPPSDSLDIAFLKVNNLDGQKLTPAAIGNSSDVQVGDSVVAIGNALGQFQNTVTSGIISGYGRSVTASADDGEGSDSGSASGSATSSSSSSENLEDLFQTDAAINEGNSGGPLVNMNGQVIGINTAIAGDAQNIGFAIPINDAKGLIEQVLKNGSFTVPYLGVEYIPLTPDVASEYNLSVENGAFIAPSTNATQPSIISGSPAASAGLQTNDIITQVDGVDINDRNSLTSLIEQYLPGDQVTLTIVRDGKTMKINATLGTEPSS